MINFKGKESNMSAGVQLRVASVASFNFFTFFKGYNVINNLKVLTDHLNWLSRVGTLDPYWQTGGSADFLNIILKGLHHKIKKRSLIIIRTLFS